MGVDDSALTLDTLSEGCIEAVKTIMGAVVGGLGVTVIFAISHSLGGGFVLATTFVVAVPSLLYLAYRGKSTRTGC